VWIPVVLNAGEFEDEAEGGGTPFLGFCTGFWFFTCRLWCSHSWEEEIMVMMLILIHVVEWKALERLMVEFHA
jgi:hypothetical protein